MKAGRVAIATLGVGAALTAGAWTLSTAAVPLPMDSITVPVVGTAKTLVADPALTDPASDPARAVADAEARLTAIDNRLQALLEQQASTALAPAASSAPATAVPPPTHTVTGASGSTSAYRLSSDVDEAELEDHDAEEQDD